MSSTTITAQKHGRRARHAKPSYRKRVMPLALNWKVWVSIFAFAALWRITVGIGGNAIVSLFVAGGVLIAFGAIRARRAQGADDANIDVFLAGDPLGDAYLAKLRYLEAIERVLNREASDQDWRLIKEHHEGTPVA
jgi:hypothetical protein